MGIINNDNLSTLWECVTSKITEQVAAETTDRKSADDDIIEKIETEESNRKSEDGKLSTAISKEVTDRETAISNLAEVASTGSYTSLKDQPFIPTNVTDLNDASNYVTDSELQTNVVDKMSTTASSTNKLIDTAAVQQMIRENVSEYIAPDEAMSQPFAYATYVGCTEGGVEERGCIEQGPWYKNGNLAGHITSYDPVTRTGTFVPPESEEYLIKKGDWAIVQNDESVCFCTIHGFKYQRQKDGGKTTYGTVKMPDNTDKEIYKVSEGIFAGALYFTDNSTITYDKIGHTPTYLIKSVVNPNGAILEFWDGQMSALTDIKGTYDISMPTTRYICSTDETMTSAPGWSLNYIVNDTALTTSQLNALNSGITPDLVADIVWQPGTGSNSIMPKDSQNNAIGIYSITLNGNSPDGKINVSSLESTETKEYEGAEHTFCNYNVTYKSALFSDIIGAKIWYSTIRFIIDSYDETTGILSVVDIDDAGSAEVYSAIEFFTTYNIAGDNSVAEGSGTIALNNSHSEGKGNVSNNNSHAEGYLTMANGNNSHSEGNLTAALGESSHAEGKSGYAYGNYSHVEGYTTYTNGESSHAEGANTLADGAYSHAGGNYTKASGDGSFSHEANTVSRSNDDKYGANGKWSVVLGGTENNTTGQNSGIYNGNSCTNEQANAVMIGCQNRTADEATATYVEKLKSYGDVVSTDADSNTHSLNDLAVSKQDALTAGTDLVIATEGSDLVIKVDTTGTIADGATYCFVEGKGTTAGGGSGTSASGTGNNAHAEGENSVATGEASHAEGYGTTASGQDSHAEGYDSTASNQFSHAEGYDTTASGIGSHAEGNTTEASAEHTHAEGYGGKATAAAAHAEGSLTVASGISSHAEGGATQALGKDSHSEGFGNIVGEGTVTETYTSTSNGFASHAGGSRNNAESAMSFIHALTSEITGTSLESAILGGYSNAITNGSSNSVILGGYSNTIESGGSQSIILGGYNNTITSGTNNSAILGGYNSKISYSIESYVLGSSNNILQNSFGSIVIGQSNTVDEASGTTYIFGNGNTIKGASKNNTIIGSDAISILQSSANNTVIGCKSDVTIQGTSTYNAVINSTCTIDESSSTNAFLNCIGTNTINESTGCVAIGCRTMAIDGLTNTIILGRFSATPTLESNKTYTDKFVAVTSVDTPLVENADTLTITALSSTAAGALNLNANAKSAGAGGTITITASSAVDGGKISIVCQTGESNNAIADVKANDVYLISTKVYGAQTNITSGVFYDMRTMYDETTVVQIDSFPAVTVANKNHRYDEEWKGIFNASTGFALPSVDSENSTITWIGDEVDSSGIYEFSIVAGVGVCIKIS